MATSLQDSNPCQKYLEFARGHPTQGIQESNYLTSMFERELGSTHLCSAFILYRSLTSTHLLPKYLFLLVNLLLTQFSIGEMFFHLLSPTTFCRNGEKTSDDCCSLFVAFADGRNRTLAACVASECSIHITIISQLFILLLNLNLCLEIPVLRLRPQHLRRGGV